MAIREAIYQPIPHVERPISDPPRPRPAGRPRLRRPVARDYALMGMALRAGPANVIMELSRPGVGHGVKESRVESAGSIAIPVRRRSESCALLITSGFLPQRFRDEMRFSWDAKRQRRFDRLMAVLGTVNGLMPRVVRQFPFNLTLWNLDRRIKKGRPLV